MKWCANIVLFTVISLGCGVTARYQPTWDSLDTRPAPKWFDEAKIGIFIHWGVFSVPSFRSEWFWYNWKALKSNDCVAFMHDNYAPTFEYPDFAPEFRAEFFDPYAWAKLFEDAGAKYVVLTSKHHEGFTMWPSTVSFNWNSMDVGPKRDIVGELAEAVRYNTSLHFGLYHSLYEWFNPLYTNDKLNHFRTQDFVARKTMPELMEIVTKYKPEVIWSDGDWEAGYNYWNSTQFLAWLYNDSPVKDMVLVNDRWGIDTGCKHGDFYNCQDRYNPGVLQKHKWENAMTLDKTSWGHRRTMNISEVMTIKELITEVSSTVSCNGNILINVGPSKEGIIQPIFQERLLQLGSWLKINGEAIYGTRPFIAQNDTINGNVWYTTKGSNIYAIVLEWPQDNTLMLKNLSGSVNSKWSVAMLGYSEPLSFNISASHVTVHMPPLNPLDCQRLKWAWTLKFKSPQTHHLHTTSK